MNPMMNPLMNNGGKCISVSRGVSQVYSFAELDDALYCGTWPEARVYRRPADGVGDWVDCGRLGDEKEVMGMITCA